MTVEEYREERKKVHSNQDEYHYEYLEYEFEQRHEGILLSDVLTFVDNLKIPYNKIHCDIYEVRWYTPPTEEYIHERVEQDVQNFIAREERNKKANIKMYLNMREKFGELSTEEIEAILKD